MTPDMTLSSTQTISLLSNGKAQQPRQEAAPAPTVTTSEVVAKEAKQNTEDTVSLSPQLQQALAEADKKEAKKLETEPVNIKETSNRSAAKVEFVYDLKGELITRYLDSSNRLVYQAPSELMLLMKESDSKTKAAVNTKA
jgi:uncharacterized FlaG/YvyC family protein